MFEHPDYLYLLLLVPAAAAGLGHYWRWRSAAIFRLGNPERIEQNLKAGSVRRFWWKNGLWLAGFALLVLAMANPRKGMQVLQTTQESSDVFIALDISQSMLAEDSKPSRLDLAKSFARKLVEALEGERIGLIFFAGNAFLQMPLSTDYTFMVQSIQNASPDLVTSQGTAIPAALELAKGAFDAESTAGRAVVLITDGEDHDEDAVEKAEALFKEGIIVLPVGAGTPEGGYIPTGSNGQSQFKRDENGELVRTRLNENLLRELALAGGGKMCKLSQGNAALALVEREIAGLAKRRLDIRSSTNAASRFQWFLLPALLLLAWEYFMRFGKKRKILSLLLYISCQPGLWAQPTAHPDLREGDRQYRKKEFGLAEEAYRRAGDKKPYDPKAAYNTGNALYRQGRYEDAAQFYEKAQKNSGKSAEKADAYHNLGNSQLKQEKWKEAAEAYENSLRLRPGDPDTKMNLQYVKQKLKAQQQQQQQQQNQQQNQDQQQNQQQQPNQQQPQNQSGPSQQPQQEKEQQQPGRLSKSEARRLLETAINNEDRRTAKKYREAQQRPDRHAPEKDW